MSVEERKKEYLQVRDTNSITGELGENSRVLNSSMCKDGAKPQANGQGNILLLEEIKPELDSQESSDEDAS